MSVRNPAPTIPPAPAVPARARVLATRLAALFGRDSEIVVELSGAQHRLLAAGERLSICGGVMPSSEDARWRVRHAFYVYQQASEQRRQLAVDVGELAQQLTDALTAAGYSPQQARSANVHELAAGTWQPTQQGKDSER